MRPFQWYLKTHWKYPQFLDTVLRDFEKPSELVEGFQQCVDRVTPSCRGTQSSSVHRCVRQELGCTFGKLDSEWTVVGHREKFAHKCSGIESSIFGNKVLSVPPNEQEGPGGLRQCNSSVLSEQARGDPFLRNVSNDMASDGLLQSQSNFAKGSSHTGLSECDSRQPFMQGQNHTNRMVSSSPNFSDDLTNLAQTNGRYVCNQNEQQTTSLCIPSPRSKCDGSRCTEYLVGGTRW